MLVPKKTKEKGTKIFSKVDILKKRKNGASFKKDWLL